MAQWLKNYGAQYGWVEVTAKEAQAAERDKAEKRRSVYK